MVDANDVKYLVRLSTNEYGACAECDQWSAGPRYSVTDHANHYVQEHGYQILHVGQETSHDDEGKPWQATVIVVGTKDRSNADRMAAQRATNFEEMSRQSRRIIGGQS
jgi:hypothetical protein